MALPSKRVMAIMTPSEKKAAMDKHRQSKAKKTRKANKSNPSGININPAHKGKFTRWAKANGFGSDVQAAARHVLANKDKYSTGVVEMANFAHNAPKFNH